MMVGTEDDTYRALMGWKKIKGRFTTDVFPVSKQKIYIFEYFFDGEPKRQTFAQQDVPAALWDWNEGTATFEAEIDYQGTVRL